MMLKESNLHTHIELYNKLTAHEEPPPEPIRLSDNDLILGTSSTTYSKDNLKLLDIRRVGANGESTTFTSIILGQAGGGKSYQAAVWYLDNLHDRFGIPIIIVDPQHEWDSHRKASFEEQGQKKARDAVDKLFWDLGGEQAKMVRHGYDIEVISPLMSANMEKRKNVDRYFAISYSDIRYIMNYSPDEGIKLLLEVLGIDSSDDNYIDLLKVVMADRQIETFAELKDAIGKKAKRYKTVSGKLLRKLRIQGLTHVISDKPEDILDIFGLLKQKVVIFQTKLKTSNKDTYLDLAFNATIKIILFKILIACVQYNLDHKLDSELKECAVLIDELDLYANETEDSSTRDFVTFLLTKGRKAGIHFGGIAQEASLVYHELFANVKIISTSVVTPNNAKPLRDRHISKEYLDLESGILSHLKVKQPTSIFTEVPQRAVIDEANKVIICYPFPSKSAHAHR
ncbi:MAG: hypothetical protein KGH62_01510 [Candidatus Micrarchaeota archaeon]|nr:hypothetical protein [Candidatus Micrarchaeota archaeon]